MGEKKKILILGGGYGGVWAGKILEKQFRKREDVSITLVDKRPFHTLMTELHEVAGWRTEPESVQVSFKKIFGAKNIETVVDTIQRIDFEAKRAFSERSEYPFDYIVIGAGAEPEYFGIPGVKENSFSLWSFDDAMRIRNHLEHIYAMAAREPDPARRRRMLTFTVAGAGFTGSEMVGELLEYRDTMCRKHFLDPKEVRIIMIEALPAILPILETPLREKAEKYLVKHGCEIMLGKAIVGAEPGKVLLKDGGFVETDTFIWTCGVKGSSFSGSLPLPMGKRGRIETDAEMKSPKYPFVYVVGDNAWYIHEEMPLAQIVESCHFSAEAAAKNIIADINGGERHKFKATYHGFMISLGGRYAVSNAGGMKTSGFMAIAMKHMINVYYLFCIAGANQAWEYLKHEILDMKENRSLIGGFASYKIRGYWPLLLRVWLGFMWVVEATNKITEGWLDFSSGLSKTGWMFSQGVVQAGQKLAEATSAATAAGDAAGAVASTAAEATSAASATATAPAAAVLGPWFDTTKNILDPSSGLVTWFRHTFMDGIFAHLPYSGFQIMIVLTELFIGLALLGGFFTWFAAVASIAMCLIFTLSGMFAWNQLWFLFAAILCMGGVGRAFGLDYWSVPFFKKWWNGTKIARRTHLYGDDPTK
ncbi:MAG TPA: NAD(P)/FAD-dependent oxidoreductase [Rectinemataceae bacterium]|nr:NAD(P)/FAD-dependent oxidoreductase [Rectinemataceae bacterium]